MNYNQGWRISLILLALSACTESQTTRATPERLQSLLDNGLASEARESAENRLDRTLNRPNSTGALAEAYKTPAATAGKPQTLDTLFASTMERNPSIGRAAQAINRADATRMNAIYGYLPQVSFNYSYTQVDQQVISTDNEVFEKGQATYPVTNTALELRQPILDLSRIFNIQLQGTARSAAEVDYIASVHAATFETFDAYVLAAQSKARREALRTRMRLIHQQIASENALVETGLTTEISGRALTAELASQAAEEALEAARFAEALSRLSFVTGAVVTDVAKPTSVASVRGQEGRMTAQDAFAAAEEHNPVLLSSALSVVQTELGRRQALATDFAPVLEAFAIYDDEEREGSRFGGGSRTRDSNMGVRLTIPIFNAQGEGYMSTIETVDLRDAALEYYATRSQLRTQIEFALARLSELSSAISQSSRALSQISANVKAEQARVETGEGIELAVLSRRLSESSARERLEFQQYEYLRTWGRLRYLTGADMSRLGL